MKVAVRWFPHNLIGSKLYPIKLTENVTRISFPVKFSKSFGSFLLVRPHEKLWLGLLGLGLGLALGLNLTLALTLIALINFRGGGQQERTRVSLKQIIAIGEIFKLGEIFKQ